MDGPQLINSEVTPNPARPRKALIRSLVLLIFAVAALIVFVLFLGDMRRKHVAVSQAKGYAATLRVRQGDGKALPMNLESEWPADVKARSFTFECLSREDAWHLRQSDQQLIVAWTVPIRRVIAPDGRAAVLFHQSSLAWAWLTESEFDRLFSEQERLLDRGEATARP